jgi:type II secretory pathway component PulF
VTLFRYEAVRADGAAVRGSVEAASGHEAAALVSARGLYPVAVDRQDAVATTPMRRASARDAGTVLRSLASLVEVGVPLHKALVVTARIAPGPIGAALTRVEARVREGGSLAAAMEKEAGLFGATTLGLVRAGERGVGLAPALTAAADDLDRRAETAARIGSALAYPVILAAVGTVSVAFIVLVIVPRFVGLLADAGAALPTATRLLIASADVVKHHAWLGVAGLVGTVALAAHAIARHRDVWHRWALDVPLVGPLRHALATARVARTLAALLRVGTPALSALDVARAAAGDEAVAGRLARARERVAEGAGLSAALAATEALTPAALQLAAIGDAAGRLPDLLDRAAHLEDALADRRVRTLVALLEPALILAFAAVVAFVAAALLQAMYSLRPGVS